MDAKSRPMTAAERYYAFLDATWPMNLILVAELERTFPEGFVGEKWEAFSVARILTRMRATAELTIEDGEPTVDFAADEVATLGEALAQEAPVAHGMDRPVICRYWTDPEREASWVALIGHHSMIDARGGVSELQAFVRFLAGAAVVPQHELSVPEPSAAHLWTTDRQELIRLLRELGEENQAAGVPEPASWPDRSLARRPRFAHLEVDQESTRELLAAAAAESTRVFPALAAAAATAVVAEVCQRSEAVVQLNVPTDLTASRSETDRPAPMNVAVLGHRHRVQVEQPWITARAVGRALARARERGEGELFFHLTRVDRADSFARGVRLVADSVNAAPPAVSSTNLGVISEAGDPPWLRGLAAYQAPTPNQIISSIGLAYRGRQLITVATDDARIAPGDAERLVAAYAATIRTMTSR